MKPFIGVVFFVFISTQLYAQMGKISGRVIDAKSGEPLPFATVYINNTTIGVTTNQTGEFVLPNLPLGSADIIFSFLGYGSQQMKVVVDGTTAPSMTIRLNPDAQQVSEVNVKASRDKTWEKQLRRFEKAFLGTTATCRILNPWVIDFVEEKGSTTANALLPLEIENKRLGYKLFFQLKRGSYSATEFSFVGTTRFVELETTSPSEALNWTKEREQAYKGSLKHLIKSILDQKLSQQGFRLYRDKEKGKPRSKSFSFELEHNLLPYDTSSLVAPGSGVNEYRIALKERVEVHYMHEFMASGFYTDVSDAVSWIETRRGYALINKEGVLLNPTDVAISGTMADARISGMLPLDYKPGNLVPVQNPTNRLAKRLQESVYIRIDKPYYYPGDKIWFSAYMNYRLPGLMDTLSRVLYVDLINPERVTNQHRILPIDSGRAAGSFSLPIALPSGQYVLRAYTQWMKNYGIEHFFYKPISILALNQRVDEIISKPVVDSSLKLTFDQPFYQTRSQVRMKLSLDTTGLDRDLKGSFSVAVLDETATVLVAQPSSIKTDFNLTELPNDFSPPFSYPIEKGLTLHGTYTDKKGKPKKTTVTLLPEDLGGIYQAPTLSNGSFLLPNLVFYDSTKFLVQSPEGSVKLAYPEPPELPKKLPALPLRIVPSTTLHVISSGDTLQAKLLTEVKVSARKPSQSENSYAHPDFYLKGESMIGYATIAEAIAAKLPSFKLIYDQTAWYLIWARASVPTSRDLSGKSDLSSHEPNLYINNVLVVGETAGDRLMQLNPTLIDHIEANGMISANQGANGSNGLLNVYTKRPVDVRSRELPFVKARGFDHETTFRSPDYRYVSTTSTPVDYRSTLYWNPRIDLTSTPLELSFFTSDQAGHYRVIIEGITTKGNTIHSEAVLTVNK